MASLAFLDLHPFVRQVAVDKAHGVIIGGALGDALGLYTEFLPATESRRWYTEPIEPGSTPFRGDSHRDKFLPGCWTDDTDHALLLVLSFLHHYSKNHTAPTASVLANDFAARLASWCEQGLLALSKPPLGLGRTIATVALNPTFLDDPHGLARQKWLAVALGEKPASNGSLMRTHPLGVVAVACDSEADALSLAATVSTATHGDPRCTLACCAAVCVSRAIIRGDVLNEDDLDRALECAVQWIKGQPQLCRPDDADGGEPFAWLKLDEFEAHTNRTADLASLQLDDSQRMGYIYKCLGAGIVTLRAAMREPASGRVDAFERHMRTLVLQGGDADTNGSVAGALLGAWLGAQHLPARWIANMTDHDWLLVKTKRFVAAAGLADAEGDAEWEATPKDIDADIHGGREPLTKQERDERERSMVFAVVAKSKQRADAERQKQAQSKKWFKFS